MMSLVKAQEMRGGSLKGIRVPPLGWLAVVYTVPAVVRFYVSALKKLVFLEEELF